jgi:hypothetical protein
VNEFNNVPRILLEALALHGEERVLPLKEGKKEGNNIFGSTGLSI